jgi:hypothetical protein
MPALAHAMQAALLAARGEATRTTAQAIDLRAGCAACLALVHLVMDPMLLPAFALSLAAVATSAETANASLSQDPSVRAQTVFVAEIPNSMMLTYLPAMRAIKGEPKPEKLYWLLASDSSARFERLRPNVLRVTAKAGFFNRKWEERSARLPLHKGDRIELSEMTITVIELSEDGRPTVCDFVFAKPIDSPSYMWVTWRGSRLRPLHLPSEGQSTTLSAG